MATHAAVVSVVPHAPLGIGKVLTHIPKHNEFLVWRIWMASTPLDLSQIDSHILTVLSQILGDGFAGTVA